MHQILFMCDREYFDQFLFVFKPYYRKDEKESIDFLLFLLLFLFVIIIILMMYVINRFLVKFVCIYLHFYYAYL